MNDFLKRCSKCVLPESYPGITFNSEGVCNFCVAHGKNQVLGEEKLLKLVNGFRSPSQGYDCILAVSGGRDSSYAAYYAVKKLGLNALVYTFDNGFMPEGTWHNVNNVVETLGLKHVVVRDDQVRKNASLVLSNWVRKPSAAMISFLCTGCTTGYTRGLIENTRSHGLRAVFTGGGEPENSFAENLLSGSDDISRNAMVRGFAHQVLQNPSYLQPVCLKSFAIEFFYRFTKRKIDFRLIPLFKYIEWNEEEILSKASSELGWRTPSEMNTSWRSDCKIHQLRQYLNKSLLGFTKNDEILSGMVREDKLTRNEALVRLEKENIIPIDVVSEVCDILNVPLEKVNVALRVYASKISRK